LIIARPIIVYEAVHDYTVLWCGGTMLYKFSRGLASREEDNEEALRWAALGKLSLSPFTL
jgi:hypothetical protein